MTGRLPDSLVDFNRLRSWMDHQELGSGPLEDVAELSGGTQNVLLRFRRDGRTYVLRRPPAHKRPNSDETMRRESIFLAALARSDVPHPALIAACPGTDVIGAAFYLMEPVSGFNPVDWVPEPHRSDPDMQRCMGYSMVDALVALGRVDPHSTGLIELGRPDGWLERQVNRWQKQLHAYSKFENYDEDSLPHIDSVGRWLERHCPPDYRVQPIHGDFHLGNMIVHPDQGKLAAVVDWELATIGDGLLDLGHLVVTWPDKGRATTSSILMPAVDLPGLPTADELIERYASLSGRDVGNMKWFTVLAGYRLGILLEGTYARACAGRAPQETGERLHAMAVELLQEARRRIDTRSRPRGRRPTGGVSR